MKNIKNLRIIEFNRLKNQEKMTYKRIFKKISDQKSNIAFIKANKEYYSSDNKKLHQTKDIEYNISHTFQCVSKNNVETTNNSSILKEVSLEELLNKDYLKPVI